MPGADAGAVSACGLICWRPWRCPCSGAPLVFAAALAAAGWPCCGLPHGSPGMQLGHGGPAGGAAAGAVGHGAGRSGQVPRRAWPLILGSTWRSCPFNIAACPCPRLRPAGAGRALLTRLAWAGCRQVAGGALGFIPLPDGHPFLPWYLVGMMIPPALGPSWAAPALVRAPLRGGRVEPLRHGATASRAWWISAPTFWPVSSGGVVRRTTRVTTDFDRRQHGQQAGRCGGRQTFKPQASAAHRIRRPAGFRQNRSGLRMASQRSSRRTSAAAPGRRCGGCCRAHAPPRRRSRGSPPARAGARPHPQQFGAALLMANVARQHIPGVVPRQNRAPGRQSVRTSGACSRRPCPAPSSGARRCPPSGGSRGLGHAPQARHFRQQHLQRPALAQHLEHARGLCSIRPRASSCHTRRAPGIHLAVLHHLAHQLYGLGPRRSRKRAAKGPRAGCTGLRERVGHMPQQPGLQVLHAVVWSNSTVAPVESALPAMELIVRSRREVFFQRDVGRALHHKNPVAPPALRSVRPARIPRAFRGAETPENRGPRATAQFQHLLGVAPTTTQSWSLTAAQKAVTHRAANHVNLHGAEFIEPGPPCCRCV